MLENLIHIEKIAGKAGESRACGTTSKKVALMDGSVGTAVCGMIVEVGEEDPGILLKDIFEIFSKKIEDLEGSILEGLASGRSAVSSYAAVKKIKVDFAGLFFYESICYFVKLGERFKILVFEGSRSVELTFEFGSGPIGENQIYLVASEDFLALFDGSEITSTGGDLGEIIDGLATEVSSREDQAGIGAAFIKIGRAEEEKEAEAGVGESPVEEKEEEVLQEEVAPGNKSAKRVVLEILGSIVSEIKKVFKGDRGAIFSLRKKIVVLGIVLVLVLVVSVLFTLSQNEKKETIVLFNQHMDEATSKFEEGKAIEDLNKARARDMFVLADKEVQLALETDKTSVKAKELADEITRKLGESDSTSSISWETVSLDSSLTSLAFDSKNFAGLAPSGVLKIDVDEKSSQEVAKDDGGKRVVLYDNKAFVLSDKKVQKADLGTGKVSDIVNFEGGLDIGVFLGNVYLLSASSISKFTPTEEGYQGPSDYLSQKFDFGQRARMVIDGSVWVASGAKIYNFLRGDQKNFEISGLVAQVGEFGPIYTDSKADSIYVVDKVNSALLVISKEGVYEKAYQSPEFSRASDIAVDETGGKMYISVADKILVGKLE